jgi:DNA-binding NtrC family response regulator
MKDGAFDYMLKPFSGEQIDIILKKAEEFTQLVKVNKFLTQDEGDENHYELLGRSPAMDQVRQIIRKVARTQATVLIHGESGTGKELVARAIYRESPRNNAPFIRVNCAAVPENLIESEFFGHEKGSFTGASAKREGRFELAHGGTILLDEISEISPQVQAKLLRVLQERELERVGGSRTIKVDVRVIATTNRDLEQSVEKKEFRQDLYFRLNVVQVLVPPLPLLVSHLPLSPATRAEPSEYSRWNFSKFLCSGMRLLSSSVSLSASSSLSRSLSYSSLSSALERPSPSVNSRSPTIAGLA